ncbi:CIC11C00000005107 [Sungouiella intermedia]|uniref:CIC11C00000005107 n=1 Tax=Sungouiella intermedia TaxID=45354 RepID=A0A1L0DG29_9ASCO|nr:CIC11C00000005107 [[Candida] intermedia]
MAKGTKRSAAVAGTKLPKKAKTVAQPPSESENESEHEATIYESASEGLDSSDISDSSEDELDKLDDDEDELDDLDGDDSSEKDNANDAESDDDNDNDEDDSEEKVADPNKKSSAEQHAEQRKLLAERKLKRKSGVEVERIKSLWEKLRVKKPTPPKQVRDKLCDEIWELSKDVIDDLVMKHDSSRVVQTLVKYASADRRDAIVNDLKGNYYKLATSSYGKFLLVKLLHYGSKESREVIINELHGKLRKLMRHKEGAYVVEDLFVLYSTAAQKQQMLREFWGAEYAVFKDSGKGKTINEVVDESAEKRQLIMANLAGTITASVNKGSTGFQILHAAMKEYVSVLTADVEKNESAIREFIELLAEQFAELVHTQEGSEVASTLIALANAKERKVIIRSLKTHGKELIKNEYGNSVLITLYMTVDDTVLVHKNFSAELFTTELVPELIQGKFSRRPLLYLLNGLDPKFFPPTTRDQFAKYEALAYAKTTKKPQDQRREELQSRALPLLYKAILETTKPDSATAFTSLISVNLAAQFITELILTKTDVEEVNQELRPQLVDAIFELTFNGDILEDHHLLNKTPFFSRSLKALIQGGDFKWDNEAKKVVAAEDTHIPSVGTDFAQRSADALLDERAINDWVVGQGAFVVLAVYEVLALLDKSKAKDITKALKSIKKDLAKDKDNKGAQLLVKLL